MRVHSSAENDIFTFYDVYMYGEDWNGISSNVDLYVMRVGETASADLNRIEVVGCDIQDTKERGMLTLGKLVPHDRYGKECEVYDDWGPSHVQINNTYEAKTFYYFTYSSEEEINTAAKKVFKHELGHALKLAHPEVSSTHTGYNSYNGFPYAIMNRGNLDKEVCASNTITDHDKSCLIGKWGK